MGSYLLRDTENDFLQDQNRYPKTITEAYNLLTNWKPDPKDVALKSGDGMSFTTVEGEKNARRNGGKGKDKSNITCYECNEKGHYSNECPNKAKSGENKNERGVQMLTSGHLMNGFDYGNDYINFQFCQHGAKPIVDYRSVICEVNNDGKVPKNWILLDNQSTVDVFYNRSLLQNIRKQDVGMEIHCNAGVTTTHYIAELPGYGTVWYHEDGIANILSLSKVKEKYRITYDSKNGNEFTVHKDDNSVHHFKESPRGLYYMDINENIQRENVLVVNTVEENKAKYTNRDYERAIAA